MKDIFIFGGGKWGLALGYAFSYKNRVYMLSRRKLNLDSIDESSTESPFKGNRAGFIKQIDYSDFNTYYKDSENPLCVIAIAMAFLREFLEKSALLHDKNMKIMLASKGIEQDSGAFGNDILESFFLSKNLCYLSGPSFAKEVMMALPCALAIHANTDEIARQYALCFPDFIKVYIKHDIIGAEVAGAYKNVIAIAGGICDGLRLGNNAKASLLARGLVEMARFGGYFGGKIETFLGLSGSGDLFLTSNSTMSRNYRVGFALANGEKLDKILENLGEVAEGVYSAKSIIQISKKHNIHTPIALEIENILEGGEVLVGLHRLLKQTWK